jgi:putative heme iron utilization protein
VVAAAPASPAAAGAGGRSVGRTAAGRRRRLIRGAVRDIPVRDFNVRPPSPLDGIDHIDGIGDHRRHSFPFACIRPMSDRVSTSAEARALLSSEFAGVLSTISLELAGYPFGSIVPYCLDRKGRPLILISRIAQHHKNLLADPRASMIVLDRSNEDVQINGRLTCVADVRRLPPDEADAVADRYYRHFPQSTDFHRIHDFEFFVLEAVRYRYIGGFGRIHWVDPAKLERANPFTAADEASMAEHMNQDHADTMREYCRLAGVNVAADMPTQLAGVDGEGFTIRAGERLVRLDFGAPVESGEDVRREMVQLARRARGQ